MTPAQAARLLPVFTAFSKGKTIQSKNYKGEWVIFDDPDFSKPPEYYRIRPEPQWRPWTTAEINQLPIDTLYKFETIIGIMTIAAANDVHIKFPAYATWVTAFDLWNNWTHSTDHGQNWKRCGVEIGEGA